MSCNAPGFWWIFPLIFGSVWLLLIGTAFFRFRWWGRGPYWHSYDPHQVLQERFARGEIDANEYQQRRSTLDGR